MAEPVYTDSDWWPEGPQTQQDQRDKERSEAVASLPAVQDILDWFDKQINELKDPSLLTDVDYGTPSEDLKMRIINTQTLIRNYQKKREDFSATFGQYLPKDADAA